MFPNQVFPAQVFTDKVFPKLFAPVAILTLPGVSYVVLVEIEFDSGTRRYSYDGVATPSAWYKNQILSISSIVREAPAIGGNFRIADARIVMSNVDREFSALKAETPFRNRTVRIRFGTTETNFSGFTTIYTGQISDCNIRNGKCTLTVRDMLFDKLDGQLGGILNNIDFPDMPMDEFTTSLDLLPILYGKLSSAGSDGSNAGAVPCYLTTSKAPFKYVVARHVCKEISRVYRYGILLASSAYSVTVATISGQPMTFIEFATDQRDSNRPTEWEVTADVEGITDNGSATGNLIQNPIRQLEHYLLNYVGVLESEIDNDKLNTSVMKLSRQKGSVAIIVQDSHAEIINKFTQSFGISLFITREGRVGLYRFTLDDLWNLDGINPITDEFDIVRNSFEVISNQELASRIQHNFRYNWLHDYFERQPDIIDQDEVANLNLDLRHSVNLWFVRDELTASVQASEHGYYKRENLQFVRFSLPIQHYAKDLNELMRISHYQGIDSFGNGYDLAIFRILGLTLYLDPHSMSIECYAVRQISADETWKTYCKLGSTAELPSDWDAATPTQKDYLFLGSTADPTGSPKGTLGTSDPIKLLF